MAKPTILGGTGQSVSRPLQKADGDKESREAELYLDLLSGLNLVPEVNGRVGKMNRLLEAEAPIWVRKSPRGLVEKLAKQEQLSSPHTSILAPLCNEGNP